MRQFIRKNIWAVAPVVFVLVALVLLGSPLSSSKVQETPAEDDNLIVVGVSQVGSESVWRSAHTQSIQDAFTRENGYMLIFDNARQKQANQIKAMWMMTPSMLPGLVPILSAKDRMPVTGLRIT